MKLTYEDLSGPAYDEQVLERRLALLPFEFATALTPENIALALKINPRSVANYFAERSELQREKLSRLLSATWPFTQGTIDAFRAIPKEAFVRPESAIIANWAGVNVIEGLNTIESAWLIAFVLSTLQIELGHHVMLLGTGSGYGAALMSHMVGPKGMIRCVELDTSALAEANERLKLHAPHPNIEMLAANALDLTNISARHNAIWATLSVESVPAIWLDRLTDGGRLAAFVDSPGGAGAVTLQCSQLHAGKLVETARMDELVNAPFVQSHELLRQRPFDPFAQMESDIVRALTSHTQPS